jgi:hypothetical protein
VTAQQGRVLATLGSETPKWQTEYLMERHETEDAASEAAKKTNDGVLIKDSALLLYLWRPTTDADDAISPEDPDHSAVTTEVSIDARWRLNYNTSRVDNEEL